VVAGSSSSVTRALNDNEQKTDQDTSQDDGDDIDTNIAEKRIVMFSICFRCVGVKAWTNEALVVYGNISVNAGVEDVSCYLWQSTTSAPTQVFMRAHRSKVEPSLRQLLLLLREVEVQISQNEMLDDIH